MEYRRPGGYVPVRRESRGYRPLLLLCGSAAPFLLIDIDWCLPTLLYNRPLATLIFGIAAVFPCCFAMCGSRSCCTYGCEKWASFLGACTACLYWFARYADSGCVGPRACEVVTRNDFSVCLSNGSGRFLHLQPVEC